MPDVSSSRSDKGQPPARFKRVALLTGQVWLDVPYDEKEEAKRAGAQWDPAKKRWYAPRPNMEGLQRWAAKPDLPTELPGEDRAFGGAELFIDMVPTSCWFTNVRTSVERVDWDRIRRMVTTRANRCCEVCGATADPEVERKIEVHERWAYDDKTQVQALRRLIALCSDCHLATHFGYAGLQGLEKEALEHLKRVNGWSDEQVKQHHTDAAAEWKARSKKDWKLDLSVLTDAGIVIEEPPAPKARRRKAGERTRAVRRHATGKSIS